MKKIFEILCILAAGSALLFTSCNQINEDERKTPYEGVISGERNVLLEDFTGVRCTNCPKAAAETHRLMEFFGNNLIVVAMYPKNPESLTMPVKPDDPDLRCEEAQIYADYYNIDNFPNGLVNRKGKYQGYPSWGGSIGAAVTSTNYAAFNGTAYLNEDKTEVNVTINGGFVNTYKAKGDIKMIVMMVEDSIQTIQIGATSQPYMHNHVLRSVISDVWGDKVLSGNSTNYGDGFTGRFKGSIKPSWKTQHLYIVAALVDDGEKNGADREVIQVMKIEIEKE